MSKMLYVQDVDQKGAEMAAFQQMHDNKRNAYTMLCLQSVINIQSSQAQERVLW